MKMRSVETVPEDLALQGYRNVIPAWYEIAMKDEHNDDIIDAIRTSLSMSKLCIVFPAYFCYPVKKRRLAIPAPRIPNPENSMEVQRSRLFSLDAEE